MIVVIDGGSESVSLAEAHDVKTLSVNLLECSLVDAGRILGDLGHLDSESAWIDIKALHALSPHAGEPGWNLRFDNAMYNARALGRTDETGRQVRVSLHSGGTIAVSL